MALKDSDGRIFSGDITTGSTVRVGTEVVPKPGCRMLVFSARITSALALSVSMTVHMLDAAGNESVPSGATGAAVITGSNPATSAEAGRIILEVPSPGAYFVRLTNASGSTLNVVVDVSQHGGF